MIEPSAAQGAFEATAALLAVTAGLAWLNARVFKLPGGVGMAFAGLLASGLLGLSGVLHPQMLTWARQAVGAINFNDIVFGALLPFLLFAGALHVDVAAMREKKAAVIILASLGVIVSAVAFGALFKGGAWIFGVSLPWSLAFLVGAIVSPTDPIAALQMLKRVPLDPRLKAKIAGESLFNDAVALLAFSFILPFATGERSGIEMREIGAHLEVVLAQALFGALLGAAVGAAATAFMRSIEDSVAEMLLSIAAAASSWAIATRLGFSAPLAVVVAGLFVGAAAPSALSKSGAERLYSFWELADDVMNSILFALMGVVALAIGASGSLWGLSALAVVCALGARALAVWVSLLAAKPFGAASSGMAKDTAMLVWSGLRGALSIALALALPASMPWRDLAVSAAYVVCVFSVIGQGLTIKFVARMVCRPGPMIRRKDKNPPTSEPSDLKEK